MDCGSFESDNPGSDSSNSDEECGGIENEILELLSGYFNIQSTLVIH